MQPSLVCKLCSQLDTVPSLQLSVGESWLIGRNSHCKIKDLRCPRQHLQLLWSISDPQKLCVKPLSEKAVQSYSNETTLKQNDVLKGPGFLYLVQFMKERNLKSEVDSLVQKSNLCSQKESFNSSPQESKKRKAVEMDQSQQNGNETKHVKQDEKNLSLCQATKNQSNDYDELVTDGWCSYDNGSLLVYRYKWDQYAVPSKKVIAFDFDGTLVDPKSGAKFARDQNDWKLKSLSLPSTIRRLNDEGAVFVIFSNQNGISTGAASEQSVKGRFKQVCERLSVPCVACLAVEDDHNRKPRLGMWQFFIQNINRGVQPDLNQCLYVGDAWGRKKSASYNGDHSAADLLFAFNAGLPVLSPEQLIAGKTQGKIYNKVQELTAFKLPKFLPPETLQRKSTAAILCSSKKESDKQIKFGSYAEMMEHLNSQLSYGHKGALVVLCGLPASGKSRFYHKYLAEKFFWINRDTLGTMDRCEKALQEQISQAQSHQKSCLACVDNTNPDITNRKRWIDLGQKAGLLVVCMEWLIDVNHCMHNEAFRRTYKGPGEHPQREKLKAVPTVAMRTSNSRYQIVQGIKEGFDLHYQLEFMPDFEHEEQRQYYAMFLKDK